MRLPLVVLAIFSVLPLSAQDSTASKKTEGAPKPKIVAPAAPTPAPKRGVMGRIFGPKATPAPTPAPVPTIVKPKPRPRPKAPKPEEPKADTTKPDQEKPATDSKPPKPEPTTEKPGTEPPAPTEKPADEKPAAEKPADEKPPVDNAPPKPDKSAKAGKTGKGGKNAPKSPAKPTENANLDDGTKYTNAKATALEDEKIKDLKTKAENAVDDAEAHRASVAYNKALYRKIREIDSSLDGYVERLEEAMMKRLDAEKAGKH